MALQAMRGFLVHAWADHRRDRLYFAGRLEDGRSFAVIEKNWRPSFHIYEGDLERCGVLLSRLDYRVFPGKLEDFSGRERLALLRFARFADRTAALKRLGQAGITTPDGDIKPAEAFLAGRYIRGPVEIRGESRRGREVGLVFTGAELLPAEGPVKAALRIASVDIETDTRDNSIRAVGISLADSNFAVFSGHVRVLASPSAASGEAPREARPAGGSGEACAGETRAAGGPGAAEGAARVYRHGDERSLLEAFVRDIRKLDPDLLTGWNFLDFDFPHLAARCEKLGIPFALGRAGEQAKFFAGEAGWLWHRRSAAALVPGRQVVDALRVTRSGPRGWGQGAYADFTLETVARTILGEGKTVASRGKRKIEELDSLYAADPESFARYCYRDAELVLRILAATGLFSLTMERASLTGVSLDKAWTSVASFERIYALELRRRSIAPPPAGAAGRDVSGAAGGTVLDPLPGFFPNVAVYDFRSLYPTIMRTFNIDPLAHERASLSPAGAIIAPNGAAFTREPGALPELISGYFASRRKALDAGDETAAFVYKILMNSFYGVLGTASCRYGRTELAGAITSFARKWLYFSRDWFAGKGYRVLYGDTDSLFVETGLGDSAAWGEFQERCAALAGELNLALAGEIRKEYGLESCIELRCEKAYRRLLIPPLRTVHDKGEARGRAKGYGGYLLTEGGVPVVEVKGMEAVRSDSTPLARRVQVELLELVFSNTGEGEYIKYVTDILGQLRTGSLDDELAYRKRLSRPPEAYTAATPPQVKAARALGWKGKRGTVEFVWTVNGPEPSADENGEALLHAPFDYDHYTDSQILPVAQSIAAAMGWRREIFPQKGKNRDALQSGQLELEL
ncbi:MAG: DNA polymerase II [Spirochaetaceae bacterium]|jgi:DNA polymerase-2|nr:DNA polymerase II [Spirochaetaceae bacterium]